MLERSMNYLYRKRQELVCKMEEAPWQYLMKTQGTLHGVKVLQGWRHNHTTQEKTPGAGSLGEGCEGRAVQNL
jgi:hypothetical protein